MCGDASGNNQLNLLDVAFLVNYLYRGGPAPAIHESADADSSGSLNILDVSYLIAFLYKGGSEPNCP